MIIDVTRLVGRLFQKRLPTGVDRVDIEYIRHYSSSARAVIRYLDRWIFLSHTDSQEIFSILISNNISKNTRIRYLVFCSYFTQSSKIPSIDTIFLNISHSGLDKDEYIDNLKFFVLKPIFFLHDLIPISHPEYSRENEDKKHKKRLKTILSSARGIIVNSHDTLDKLITYANQQNFMLPPTTVAHLASAPLAIVKQARPIENPYFVLLGTIEPRKNHILILNIWRNLALEMGLNAPHLVIIGQRGWECENVVDMLERCDNIKPFVHEISFCSDTELSNYLTHASALLFPSFVEGYGMPLVEALSMNVPVIASNLNVFREIAGNIPEYIDPLDGLMWKKSICEYSCKDSSQRKEQIERMRGFVSPSWSKHFQKVDEFINSLEN
jgi:glycosyltransferase involved in cell wall biosynthesis